MFRVGFGYDVHPFASGRSLIIGGINVPHEKGLAGHSDADVLIHAVIDALLGALSKGDIGNHFPDSDPANKGLDSTVMLHRVMAWTKDAGFRINNLDTTVVAEKPKLAPYIMAMRERLSDVLETSLDQISVKATTTEGMGFCGREEGIAAYAVVSLTLVTEET